MIFSRSRLVAGILSIVFLAISFYVLAGLSIKDNPDTSYQLDLIAVAIFSFNIPILLAWIAFGIPGGLALMVFSILAVVFFDLKMGLYGYHIFILP
ncbi:MAG TPA: hypothetical protein PKG81_08490, partial [Candidatus Omnitrophota bacterium]|nr:hypothetical protein [Candidatus Omnitrophota bacterium]